MTAAAAAAATTISTVALVWCVVTAHSLRTDGTYSDGAAVACVSRGTQHAPAGRQQRVFINATGALRASEVADGRRPLRPAP